MRVRLGKGMKRARGRILFRVTGESFAKHSWGWWKWEGETFFKPDHLFCSGRTYKNIFS
jgi:hypothetical protein